jgi:transposase InsO family protein
VVTAPARRDLVRWMQSRELSERRGLQVVHMSASSLRYQPRSDRDQALRSRIVTLAQRFRRYGAGPNQNAYVESFNGRLRDECLNEHWFTSLEHARAEIERWRREYNEERPKKSLGGLTPLEYAKQLAGKAVTIPENSNALRY